MFITLRHASFFWLSVLWCRGMHKNWYDQWPEKSYGVLKSVFCVLKKVKNSQRKNLEIWQLLGVSLKNEDHHNYADEIYNKIDTKKINVDTSKGAKFALQNQFFFYSFLKNLKTCNFVPQFSTWKQRLQKKQSIPCMLQQKFQNICNLIFWIFKTLSQRFFDLNSPYFNFLRIHKKNKFWQICRTLFQLSTHIVWSVCSKQVCMLRL